MRVEVRDMNCLLVNLPFAVALVTKVVFVQAFWYELASPSYIVSPFYLPNLVVN